MKTEQNEAIDVDINDDVDNTTPGNEVDESGDNLSRLTMTSSSSRRVMRRRSLKPSKMLTMKLIRTYSQRWRAMTSRKPCLIRALTR